MGLITIDNLKLY